MSQRLRGLSATPQITHRHGWRLVIFWYRLLTFDIETGTAAAATRGQGVVCDFELAAN